MGEKVSAKTALLGSDAAVGDQLYIVDASAGSSGGKSITLEELFSALAILGLTLADVPEYADQAAAATALTGTGQLWRQTTTGLLGVTIT